MGTWSTSITGNDTAQDLLYEYAAVFYKYDPVEAVQKIDSFVRDNMFDESDEEEWCNYIYSLAGFMWKKGILTDEVREKAIQMIDSGFGLEIWAEEGEKTLKKRRQILSEFREKLLSPMPPRKKIKPNVHMERIFENGDLVAIQLQTIGKPYINNQEKIMTDDEFHACNGKYILMQLIEHRVGWSSEIVPEVKDYWARFRLFDGVYDTVPKGICFQELKPAKIHVSGIFSCFTCESNLFYFKRRKYQVIGNEATDTMPYEENHVNIFFGINKPWYNPDSHFLAAMGKDVVCGEHEGIDDRIREICHYEVRYGEYNYRVSKEENNLIFAKKEAEVIKKINDSVQQGGRLLSLQFGNRTVGIVTAAEKEIDNLYIDGRFQKCGFETQLLQYAISYVGDGAYMIAPKENRMLTHICEEINTLEKAEDIGAAIRFTF